MHVLFWGWFAGEGEIKPKRRVKQDTKAYTAVFFIEVSSCQVKYKTV
jgi:hypothetical protein